MNKDLTVGKPSQVLWQFCLPMFGSIIFQQLYNIADSLVAGKFIGENALAAVGNSYEITLIFIAFAFGCNIGCSVIVSRYFGAKEYGEMKTSVYTSLIGSAVLCAVLMGIGLFGCDALLELINTPEEILADSALYLDIYVLGLPFMFFYNIATGIFSALGDSKTPFYFLAVSSLSNIGVDILFVAGFQMGVAGVAWATLIAQGICAVASLAVLFLRMKRLPCEAGKEGEKIPLFHKIAVKRIAQIGLPSMLQQSLVSLSMMMMQGLVNSYGKVLVAGYTAATKIDTLAMLPNMNFSNAMSSYTAQNIGANRYDRVKEGLKRPKSCPFDCIRTCDVTHSPYCIMLALYNAFKGRLQNGYAFCGANAWRTEKIQSVRELIASLRKEYESFSLRDRLFPNKG